MLRTKRFFIKKGVTLVELVVVIAILSIVLTVAYNMNLFGNKAYNIGEQKSNIQSNLRLEADYLTKQLRYGSELRILSALPATLGIDCEYIYVEAGKLKHCPLGGNLTNATLVTGATDITTSVKFNYADADVLKFTLAGSYKTQSFSLDTSVYLLNMGAKSLNNPGTDYTVIEYKPGIAADAGENGKPIDTITINPIGASTVQVNGGSLQFSAAITPSDASYKTVDWFVADSPGSATPSVNASIDTNGLLSTNSSCAIDQRLYITARALDGTNKISNEFQIRAIATGNIKVNGFTIYTETGSSYVFGGGGTTQMKIKDVDPYYASDQTVSWQVAASDTSYATINASTGLLQTTSNANRVISVIATANDGSGVTRSYNLTILPKVTLSVTPNITAIPKNNSRDLNFVVSPINTPEGILTSTCQWTISPTDGDLYFVNSSGNNIGYEASGETVTIKTPKGNPSGTYTIKASAKGIDGKLYNATDLVITVN